MILFYFVLLKQVEPVFLIYFFNQNIGKSVRFGFAFIEILVLKTLFCVYCLLLFVYMICMFSVSAHRGR